MEILRSAPTFSYAGKQYSDTSALEEVEQLAHDLGVCSVSSCNLESLLFKCKSILLAQNKIQEDPIGATLKAHVRRPVKMQHQQQQRERKERDLAAGEEEEREKSSSLTASGKKKPALKLGLFRESQEESEMKADGSPKFGWAPPFPGGLPSSDPSGSLRYGYGEASSVGGGLGGIPQQPVAKVGSLLFDPSKPGVSSGGFEGFLRDITPTQALEKIRLALMLSPQVQIAGKFDPAVNIEPLKTAHWDPNFLTLMATTEPAEADKFLEAIMKKQALPADTWDRPYNEALTQAESASQAIFPRTSDYRQISRLSAEDRVKELARHAWVGTNLARFAALLRVAGGNANLDLNMPIDRFTLANGVEVNAKGQTILMLLVTGPDFFSPSIKVFEMMEALLSTPSYFNSRGVDLNRTDKEGWTVLHHLVKKCAELRKRILRESLSNQMVQDTDRKSNKSLGELKSKALLLVHHLFRRILEDKSDPPIISVNKDNKGITPLWLATHDNCTHCVLTLVKHSRELLDARRQDQATGSTPLQEAVRNDNLFIAAMLSRQWMAPASPNLKGQTPFHLAARMLYDWTQYRSDQAAKIWKNWKTDYMATWDMPDPSIFQLLLKMLTHQATAYAMFESDSESKASRSQKLISDVLNHRDNEGVTALIIAAISMDEQMVKHLLSAGASSEIPFAQTKLTARDLVAHLLLSPHSAEQKKKLTNIASLLSAAQGRERRKARSERAQQVSQTGEVIKNPKLKQLLSGTDPKDGNKPWVNIYSESLRELAARAKLNKDLHKLLLESYHMSSCRSLSTLQTRQEKWATIHSLVENTDEKAGKPHLQFLKVLETMFKRLSGVMTCEELLQSVRTSYETEYSQAAGAPTVAVAATSP